MNLFHNIIDIIKEKNSLKLYGEYYKSNANVIKQILHYYKYKKNYNIAIWGSGYKGKAFLSTIDKTKKYIDCVYDINELKHGQTLTTGHKIVNYSDEFYQTVDVVLIMNGSFETEIAGLLKEAYFYPILVNVDSIICGRLTAYEALKMYGKRK